MSRLSVKAAVCTDIGLNRTNNEDNYYLNGKCRNAEDDSRMSSAYISAKPCGVFAVFDGMGGQSRGEFASLCGAKLLNRYKDKILREGTQQVNAYIKDANEKICKEMDKTGERIGSTAVILAVENGKAQVYNLGDSRAYYIHKGQIYQLSKDHTVAAQLYQLNMLSKDEAMRDVRKHRLTKHLGIYPSEMRLRASVSGSIRIEKDDVFLLCSDGVTNAVTDRELRNLVLTQGDKCKKLVNTLVELALKNQSSDNITAMAVKVVNSVYSRNNKRWGRHPRLYPFLLGVGISSVIFAVIVAIILLNFMK